ncbi:nucleoside hydrolase [Streptomonospora wellingtoniae]|uniref:Nucleoside hydrolase n=1 Tax=Streptomonospora wellingtoniae TaxID=3075544 RepID=A0ABU2KNQ5_9ACTN|nr:nucleoside hydrolase [Streptomonospora sp. DSM 45055]MDT0300808.1 nucleoside hydrolase [Streptomonospora sp. DSM 45055]
MGDDRNENTEELRCHRQAIIDLGEAMPGSGPGALGEALPKSDAWPEDLRDTPMIIDTDIGGDADDALAVALAARCVSHLALVTTADETGSEQGRGQRARFARYLLDSVGRTETPVTAGADLGGTRYYCVEGLTPAQVPPQEADVVSAVRRLAAERTGPIRWVGMGPMTNLADLLSHAPEVASRLRVTQMGGALRYRDPERAEHNFRLDAAAVHTVFGAIADGLLPAPEFVTSEVTYTPEIRVDSSHALYRKLRAFDAPPWAALLGTHLDRWFSGADLPIPGTLQHDALTLSAALKLPFVQSEDMPLAVDDIGRTTVSVEGTVVQVSTAAHYSGFMSWLQTGLDPAIAPAPRP